jgi:putative peptidoglycan lipid II flippase
MLKARGLGDIARFDTRFHARIWRIVAASIAMGTVLWGTKLALAPMLDQNGLRAIALLILVSVGIISFFAIAHVFGAVSLSDFKARFHRRSS